MKYKGSVGSCLRILHVSFNCPPPPRNLLSIRHGGTLGGQVVSASDEFEDNEGVVYWVNVSESPGADSPGLLQIRVVVVVVVVWIKITL